MKKKILSLAVATAGLVGAVSSAQAEMHINDKGLGEALIYPFYSAANGNDTYVHVVNTTDRTKAVKVRFIEAMNSQEVLDFNLYLSPEDVWAGVITAAPNGQGAMIRTLDSSCTVPELGTAGGANVGPLAGSQEVMADGRIRRDQPFVNFNYSDDADDFTGLERTTEGYIEIIEMGQLDPESGLGAAAVHDADGFPEDCGLLVDAWSDGGDWDDDPQDGFDTWGENSSGGLYGFGVLLNVEKGTSVGFDAVAIDAFYGGTALHFEPGDELPSLANANEFVTIFDGINAVEYDLEGGAEAVSALFMSTAIMNDYVIDPDINAGTDWVVTMPTKRFFVQDDPAAEPFSVAWDSDEASACEPVGMAHWDREELFPNAPVVPGGPVFSPQPETAPVDADEYLLCTEVTVIQFGSEPVVNGSTRITAGFTPEYNEGWARMGFLPSDLNDPDAFEGDRELVAADDEIFYGLPVIGFAAFAYQNGQLAGGVLSNYAAATTHKSESVVELPLP